MRQVQTPWGRVGVKVGLLENRETTASPEFEDCLALAKAHDIPVRAVYEAALATALKGEYSNE